MWALASPIALFIGTGGSLVMHDGNGAHDYTVAVEASAVRTMNPELALGLHTRFSKYEGWDWTSDNTSVTSWEHSLWTLDIGVAARFPGRRWFVQPWLGGHFARGTTFTIHDDDDPTTPTNFYTTLQPAPSVTGGLLIAIDIVVADPHRCSLFFDAQASTGEDPGQPDFGGKYTALTLGLAYRTL